MGYLEPADYEAYGLAPETADELITMASALMEGHCRRPTLMAAQYVERVRLSESNQTARLSYGPLAAGAITAVRVRYGRNAREGFGGEIAQAFALPGSWASISSTAIEVYFAAREISFGGNILGLAYNEAEVTYTAGFSVVQMQYFGPTLLDDGVRTLLKPYVAEKL